ncbi:MAG: dacB [Thermoleophilia bacterium]|nr:dacB [Thermoleophilia bacterium]
MAGRVDIAARIAGAVAASPVGDAASIVVRDAAGATLADVRGLRSVAPASNAKLLTAAAALAAFGPEYRFSTRLLAAGPVSDGHLAGDLVLVGGGDPALDVDGLTRLAATARSRGIEVVDGRLLLDDTRFEQSPWVESWPERFRFDQARAIGPLAITQAADGQRLAIGAVHDPTAHAGSVFRELLAREGVQLLGSTVEAATPAGAAAVAELPSGTVAEQVRYMLKHSNPTTAEVLVRQLGVAHGGVGSTEAGMRGVRAALEGLGLDLHDIAVVDGSGLTPGDRVTASSMVSLVDAAARDPRIGASFVDALSISGVDGTLRGRMSGPATLGRVHAKTGTLQQASALTGLVDQAGGAPPLRFSVIVHDPDAPRLDIRAARALQDEVAGILAG